MAQLAQLLGNNKSPLANPHQPPFFTVESQPVSPLKSTQSTTSAHRLLFLDIRKSGLFHNRVICPARLRSLWRDFPGKSSRMVKTPNGKAQPFRHNESHLLMNKQQVITQPIAVLLAQIHVYIYTSTYYVHKNRYRSIYVHI